MKKHFQWTNQQTASFAVGSSHSLPWLAGFGNTGGVLIINNEIAGAFLAIPLVFLASSASRLQLKWGTLGLILCGFNGEIVDPVFLLK